MPTDSVENETEKSLFLERVRPGFFRDEQGNMSMARILVIVTTSWDYALVAQPGSMSKEEVWLLGVVTTLNYLWAFGPRVTQYMVPAIKALGSWFTALQNNPFGTFGGGGYGYDPDITGTGTTPKAY